MNIQPLASSCRVLFRTLIPAAVLCCSTFGSAQDLKTDARQAISKAAGYYVREVAVHGGYVYYYSPDLKKRHGEGPATATQIWVQPPGTPTVGLALLDAYEATQEPWLLEAATAAAEALIYGQLQSGAWTNSIDFNPRGQTAQYRNGKGKGRNFSTLDDGISQAALQLLMRIDKAHMFRHPAVRDAVQTGLDAMLAAQFDNGAFPQGWDETPVAVTQPIKKASFPEYDWRTEGRIREYWDMYTLNDGAAGTIAQTLLVADRIYGTPSTTAELQPDLRYRKALQRLGEFLILAQLPEPQPAWAQQYSFQMHPIWARRFEPAAVASRESQDVIRTLMKIAAVTEDDRYLKPIPAALQYLQRSLLPDGRLSRYYELQSNRPLYMSRSGKNYSLTYDDRDLPNHYGWKIQSEIAELTAAYTDAVQHRSPTTARISPAEVQQILNDLDDSHRWLSRYDGEPLSGQPKFADGEQYLNSDVFSRNLTKLSEFILSE
ncbi:MAG: pectate lyase [Planctomycetaceae bacterium]